MIIKLKYLLLAIPLLLAVTGASYADVDGEKSKDAQDEATMRTHDAWLTGKVEMALLLNRYLNSFKIDTRVDDANVVLTGTVESDIDRDLAEQIVLGIKGVRNVDNDLEVDATQNTASEETHEQRALLQRIRDVTLTARVKSKLALNNNIRARYIDVDTENAIVTLKGEVRSEKERDLAVKLVQNTDDVEGVTSELKISQQLTSS